MQISVLDKIQSTQPWLKSKLLMNLSLIISVHILKYVFINYCFSTCHFACNSKLTANISFVKHQTSYLLKNLKLHRGNGGQCSDFLSVSTLP